jgi:hypothetical protein
MSPLLPWLLAAAGTTAALPVGGPPPGAYAARLCVTVNRQPPSCGPADAHLAPDGELRVRVHDITYVIGFEQALLVGITMHGNIQVAEYSSSYRWAGLTLLFGDTPRGLQYELQLSPQGRAPTASGTPAPR